jgi:retron-type reverse transcriptase
MRIYGNVFDEIIAPETLFAAWDAFSVGKRHKTDVARFEWHLEKNLFQLHRDLAGKSYRHGPYTGFYIHDPKQRHIHKATVRDRILHHAACSILALLFERTFIPTSFSCRIGYGTHRGVAALETMIRKASRNGTRPAFALKADVQKFFDNVDHEILLSILGRKIKDADATWLLRSIVQSYAAAPFERETEPSPTREVSLSATSRPSSLRIFT